MHPQYNYEAVTNEFIDALRKAKVPIYQVTPIKPPCCDHWQGASFELKWAYDAPITMAAWAAGGRYFFGGTEMKYNEHTHGGYTAADALEDFFKGYI
jgi:hypothetical protein